MARKYKSFPLVCIEWEDHSADSGWVEEEDMSDMGIRCKTVGWLVKETPESYHIVDTLTDDEGQGGYSHILRPCVIKVKTLRKKY
jgi:hypothetical protein